jgi:hypothetical protein
MVSARPEEATRTNATAAINIRIGNAYPFVIARSEATKQSSFALEKLDCFASLAMTNSVSYDVVAPAYFAATFGLP